MKNIQALLTAPFRWFFHASRLKQVTASIALALVLLVILGIARGQKGTPLTYASVTRQDVKQQVSASGTLTGDNSASLHFIGSGRLSYITVKVGDRVEQGQVIAGLDTQQLAINLQEAQNTLRDKQATVDKTLDDIHLSQYGMGGFANVGSANETETQRQARTTAEAARDNAQRAVEAAQRAYQDNIIVAPIAGVVTQANPLPGQTVVPTDTVAQVVDFSQIIFAADVDEADVSKINLGQNAEVTLNAYGDKTFTGSVTDISPQTHTTTNGGTVVTVKIALNDQSIKTITGLNGQANITIAQSSHSQTIPQDALVNGNTVYVKTAKGVQKRTVTTGLQNDTAIEITSGLSEKDQVVTNPSVVTKNQSAVNPLARIFRR